MANIFLSYDRDDDARARPIAALLEKAGHSVWWDRQIKGGGEFGAEIEAALDAADKIVVLWSERAVKSAWVRDEAAVGRDTGRLVPVTIDGTRAPIGFRQFQTIDLSRWKGRSGAPEIAELLEALGAEPQPGGAVASAPRRGIPRPKLPRWSMVAVVLIVLIIVGGGWWWANRASAHPPTVAIDGVNSQSREVARQLAVRLGELQSARGDAFQLISGSGDADLRLQIDASDAPNALRRDLTILSGANRSILWSASLTQPPDKADDLVQQLTVTAEQVLSCGLEALSDRRDRVDPPTLKLYLSGCSRLEGVYGLGQYDPALVKLLEQVVARAPHLEGAWAKLLAAEAEVVRNPDVPRVLVDRLKGHISAAEKLAPNLGELYAARASLLPQQDFLSILSLLDKGIEADPDNALLFRLHSEEAQRIGRMNDAVYDASQALRFDPLSPASQDAYISALAYAGKIDAAYEQLRKGEAMWPGASNIQMARFRLDLRFGDPREALKFYRSRGGGFDQAMESFIMARIDPSPANIQRAIDSERAQYAQEPRYIGGLFQVFGQFGRIDEAVDLMAHYTRPDAIGFNAEVMFRPASRNIWRDPRSMAGAAHVGFLRYWQKSGRWPDFCADPTLPYDCKKEAAKYPV